MDTCDFIIATSSLSQSVGEPRVDRLLCASGIVVGRRRSDWVSFLRNVPFRPDRCVWYFGLSHSCTITVKRYREEMLLLHNDEPKEQSTDSNRVEIHAQTSPPQHSRLIFILRGLQFYNCVPISILVIVKADIPCRRLQRTDSPANNIGFAGFISIFYPLWGG